MDFLNTLNSLLLLLPAAALLVPVLNRLMEDRSQKVRVRIDENERKL